MANDYNTLIVVWIIVFIMIFCLCYNCCNKKIKNSNETVTATFPFAVVVHEPIDINNLAVATIQEEI